MRACIKRERTRKKEDLRKRAGGIERKRARERVRQRQRQRESERERERFCAVANMDPPYKLKCHVKCGYYSK